MGRSKRRVYFSKVSPRPSPIHSNRLFSSKGSSDLFTTHNRLPKSPRHSRATLHQSLRKGPTKALARAESLRKKLVFAAGLAAVLNACLCGIGYFVINVKNKEMKVRAGVLVMEGLLSLAEIVCIAMYWSLVIKIGDTRNAALSVEFVANASLFQSPSTLCTCLVECIFHVLIPIPGLQVSSSVHLFGVGMDVSLNDYLYASVLFRNYHWLRAFYWTSRFSSIRTLIYARITTVASQGGFFFRCCLAVYKFKFIMLIYGAMVVTGGIIQTTLERKFMLHQDKAVWSGLWVVAYTQGSIGYGDEAPVTFPAQAAILINVLLGSILMGLLTTISLNSSFLSLKNFKFCSYLRSLQYKRRHSLEAVHVIQCWWRLIQFRIRKCPRGANILDFYSALRKFRAVLVKCNTIESGLFQNQVEVVGETVSCHIKAMNEYLYSIKHVDALVLFI